jgi:hypothetical protein
MAQSEVVDCALELALSLPIQELGEACRAMKAAACMQVLET